MNIFFKFGLVFFAGFLFWQCQKDEDLGSSVHSTFETKLLVANDLSELFLTDTLWVSSEVVGYLVDSVTKTNVFFSEAILIQNLIIRSWNSENQVYQPNNYSFIFETYCNQLSQTSEASMARFIYEENNNKYKLKVGLLFKKAGVYSIDADKLILKTSDQTQYFGGGVVGYNDLDGNYHEGYLSATFENEETNYELYQNLTEFEKAVFQPVSDFNKQKYYFIHVLDSTASIY